MLTDKVGIIGLGNISNRHRENIRLLYPDTEIVCMSSTGRTPREVVDNCDKFVTSIEELIDESPQWCFVASPAPFHAEHAIPLIETNIPVLIEKPVSASIADAERLINTLKKYPTPVAIGHCIRYMPSGVKMKKLLDENYIGDIYNIFIQVGQYLPDWRPNKNYHDSVSANVSLGGGALLELSHELDYAQWLFGDLNVESAILRSSKELNLNVEDIADITLSGVRGAICNIHLDFLQRTAYRACSVIGNKGRLDWDLVNNNIIYSGRKGSEILYSQRKWDKNNMYLAMMQDFKTKIKGQPHQCIELNEAMKTIRLVEAIRAKANRGAR